MKIRKTLMALVALAMTAGTAGLAAAEDSLDALTPIDSSGLGEVKGAVTSKDESERAPRDGSISTTPTASSFEGANTLAGNEANNVGLGVISLNNNVEHNALSLSNSLITAGAGTGTP